MYRFDREHYLNSPKLLLAQHRRRARRRLHFTIDDIEPRAKHSMPDPDKDEVQGQLLKHLVDRRRRAFQGPLALRVRLATTERSPTHSQNIAKNLLDLFGMPRQSLATRRTSLLYADDNQVHALVITCDHGRTVPMISVSANPLATLLADLDLAVQHDPDYGDAECEQSYELDDQMHHVGTLLHDEAAFRSRLGDRAFDTWLRFSRQRAQERLLGRAGITPIYLANMYNLPGRHLGFNFSTMWEQMFASSPLRIQLSELPQITGASLRWRQEIETKLRDFQARFGWLVDPLLIPVALEVIIKPPPVTRQNGLHDLDNVLRKHLIPRVVDVLRPISHYAFTTDDETIRQLPKDLCIAGRTIRRPTPPPASTKSGISRYEVWRLPPADEGDQGFVSVAVIADRPGHRDAFAQIESQIEQWRKSLEDCW
jgi:hypothetical protein